MSQPTDDRAETPLPPQAPVEAPAPVPPEAPPAPATPHRRGRAKGAKLVRHFKVDHALAGDDRAQYEALLLDPRQTTDSLLKWLRDKGYAGMSRAAVARHRRQFEIDIKGIRRDARVAGQFAALARGQGGATALADAGQFRFEQLFLQQLFRMKKTDARAAKDWLELGRTMAALLGNRRQVEEQRAPRGSGRKAVDGVALANRVRRRLGMPPFGEPSPN